MAKRPGLDTDDRFETVIFLAKKSEERAKRTVKALGEIMKAQAEDVPVNTFVCFGDTLQTPRHVRFFNEHFDGYDPSEEALWVPHNGNTTLKVVANSISRVVIELVRERTPGADYVPSANPHLNYWPTRDGLGKTCIQAMPHELTVGVLPVPAAANHLD